MRPEVDKDDWAGVKTELAVISTRLSHVEKDLEKINASSTWLVRLVVGAVILGLIGTLAAG